MGKRYLGLDIHNSFIAAVIVSSSLKGYTIQEHAYIPVENKPDGNSGFSDAMEILTDHMDIAGSTCTASFPAEQVYFRNIQVPFKQSKKIRQIMPFELERSLPLSVERLVIDFHTIKPDQPTEHTDLIAAAVDMSRLESYLNRLTHYGIDPEIVTVSGYPTAVCLSQSGDMALNAMLVDVNTDRSTVFVLESGQLSLVRSITSGSQDMPRTEVICQNIQRTLHAAIEADNDQEHFTPETIYLTGPTIGENGFESEVTDYLKIPARKTDLVTAMEDRLQNQPTGAWEANSMDNALALALMDSFGIKGLNFRRGPFALKKRWVEHRKSLIRTGIFAAIALVFMLANAGIDYFAKQKRLNDLKAQIETIFLSTFPDVRKVVDPLNQMQIKMEQARKSTLSPTQSENSPLMIDVLNALSKSIPGQLDLKFTRLIIGEDNVTITGNTDTFNTVDTVKGRLEADDMFQSVTIVSTSKDKTGNRIRFRLKVKI